MNRSAAHRRSFSERKSREGSSTQAAGHGSGEPRKPCGMQGLTTHGRRLLAGLVERSAQETPQGRDQDTAGPAATNMSRQAKRSHKPTAGHCVSHFKTLAKNVNSTATS